MRPASTEQVQYCRGIADVYKQPNIMDVNRETTKHSDKQDTQSHHTSNFTLHLIKLQL